jgi:hypothetical protein
VTYPPTGNDPYGQQPAPHDPYASPVQPVSPDPYATPYPPQPDYSQQQPAYGAYGQPAGYTNPYGAYPMQAPKTNGMAIASMVLGIVGLVLLCCYGLGGLPGVIGAILGHVSMKQIRERGENGRGMALAGVITGWSAFALSVIFWVIIVIVAINDPTFMDSFNEGYSSSYDD